MSRIFNRFVEKTPVRVRVRAAMEHAMAPEALDALFVQHANKQHTRELLIRLRWTCMAGDLERAAMNTLDDHEPTSKLPRGFVDIIVKTGSYYLLMMHNRGNFRLRRREAQS